MFIGIPCENPPHFLRPLSRFAILKYNSMQSYENFSMRSAMDKQGGRYDALDISDTIKHLHHFFRIAVRSGIESTGFESTLVQKKTY
jgi:hypothetical protein